MTQEQPSRTPLTDAFIRRVAEGMAGATFSDRHGKPITVTEKDVERYADPTDSPETIAEAKRLAAGGFSGGH